MILRSLVPWCHRIGGLQGYSSFLIPFICCMVAEPPESWFSSFFLRSRVEAPVALLSFPDVLENSSSPRGPAATQTSGSSRTNEQNSSRMEKNLNNSRWQAAEVALNSHDGHFAEIEIVFLIKKHADQPLALAHRRLSLPAAAGQRRRSPLPSRQPSASFHWPENLWLSKKAL